MVINPVIFKDNKVSDIYSLNLDHRIVHLCGEIDDASSQCVVAQLLYLDSLDDSDIFLYINSPGGSVHAGLAIYDTMQHLRSSVITVCVGIAASMAAVILAGGCPGKRRILKHSEVMIHQPSGGMDGRAGDMIIEAEHIKRLKNVLTDILAEHSGTDRKQIETDIEKDFWMNAEEACSYGLVDEILQKNKEV